MSVRPWQLATLGLTGFGLATWFGGPLLAIGRDVPLASAGARVALIGAFALCYLAYQAWAANHARRRNESVVAHLAPTPDAGETSELAQLRKRFADAVETLRRTRFGPRGGTWSSLSWKFARQYLYQLPWYLIVGAPGAGKTTALLNSGLQFPLAGEFGRGSIKGVGGTRNCDWWFTDRAVLLDTAGRYTTHEAHRMADRQAWEGFLELLKRARPRQPLNGVLVAVSITDLLVFDPIQRAQHAATLRARLDEIRSTIGIRLPVYLLLTKCDLLPGFLDSFFPLDKKARDQVWGTTFDFSASERGRAADYFAAAFEQLVARLHEGLIERMQAERDPQRRARIFSFPRHFAALGHPLDDLVRQVFAAGNSSALEGAPCLRGVYFTSGTQEGTPIDRALSALGRELGLERQILPPNQSTGKSFFLAALLRDIVFAESEIAGRSPRLQRWRSRAITALLVGLQCGGVLLAANWATNYTRSSAEIDEIAQSAQAAAAPVQSLRTPSGSDPRPLLPALNTLQDLVKSASPSSGESAPLAPFRRHQRLKLDAAARQTYDRALLETLLPTIARACEEQMRSGSDPNLQYEALKAYTMMHDAAHFDAAALKGFVLYDWDTALEPPLSREERTQLAAHLHALVEAGAAGTMSGTDSRLVESVRAHLAGQPVSQRIAARLRSILSASSYPPFEVASLGAPAAELFAGKDGHSEPRSVPGRYTVQAYRDTVLNTLPALPSQLAVEATWVLGAAPPASERAATGRAIAEALASYLDSYQRSWSTLVDDLRLRHATSENEAIAQAQNLARTDGPLVSLLRQIVQQTSLHSTSATTALGDAAAPLEGLVEEHFAALRDLVRADKSGRAGLDSALADFRSVQTLRPMAAPSNGSGARAPLEELERIRAESRRFPEPVRTMLLSLAVPPAAQQPGSTAAHAAAPGAAAR
ncbi:MAG: type VI secretion system membrane subunit TssM [Burkholderiaceae bacterium]|nr:type VI secretion system membrane subunit TssM [Burkholderiaceae bacterium]